MPNHVFNRIRIHADEVRRDEILKSIQNDEAGLGSIDFNKLIPMPPSLNIECGSRTDKGLKLYKEYIAERELLPDENRKQLLAALLDKYKKMDPDPEVFNLGQRAFNNIKAFGCATWYEWSNRNWGTKWNAYDFDLKSLSRDGTIVFNTAWSGVPAIIEALSKRYPDVVIEYEWADEDIAHNIGQTTIKDGEVIGENIPEGGSREAFEMYETITGEHLDDIGFVYSEKEGTYVYDENEEPLPELAPAAPAKKPKNKQPER